MNIPRKSMIRLHNLLYNIYSILNNEFYIEKKLDVVVQKTI